MRGFMECSMGPFGRHFRGMGSSGHHGSCNRFGYGSHFGPCGHHFGPPGHQFGPHLRGSHRPPFAFRGVGWGPDFGPDTENCCKDNCKSALCQQGPQGDDSPDCSNPDHRQERRDPEECGCSPDKRPCGRPSNQNKEKSSRPHGPCHERRGRHRHQERPGCSCDRDDESGPEGPHGYYGPMRTYGRHKPYPYFGGHFGHYRRFFGPWNRQDPCDCCQRNNTDEESGNETERRGQKNRPCCKNNKDQNRDDTFLIQRIIVEKVPRCKSI